MSTAEDINKEASAHQSQPVEFYRFTVDSQDYLYASADTDIFFEGRKYLKAAIQRGAIDGATDPDKATLKLTVPYGLPITQQILVVSPSFPISLTVYRAQRRVDTTSWSGADENPGNYLTVGSVFQVWVGRVFSCEITGDEVSVNAVSVISQQYRMGNTLKYQKACQYALYEHYNCGVNANVLATALMIDDVPTATKINSPGLKWEAVNAPFSKDASLKGQWFVGGYITYYDSVAKVQGRRTITEYRPDIDPAYGQVTVFPNLRGFVNGEQIVFHPGCRHNSSDCHRKFNNLGNYGGDPVIPTKDPYDPFEKIMTGGL